MSLIAKYLQNDFTDTESKRINFEGLQYLDDYVFYSAGAFTTLEVPNTVKSFGLACFQANPQLKNLLFSEGCTIKSVNLGSFASNTIEFVDLSKVSENTEFNVTIALISDTPWYKNLTEHSYAAHNKILFKMVGSGTFHPDAKIIFNSAYNIGINSTICTIPNQFEVLHSTPFRGTTTTLVIPSSIKIIRGGLFADDSAAPITNLVFEHPKDYIFEQIPSSGLVKTKDAYNLNVYTDNEYLRAYNWAGDNATVTLYPLSQAPI